jgi:HlyD family secretion protein
VKKKIFVGFLCLATIVLVCFLFLAKKTAPVYKTSRVERGALVSTVSSTGTLNAVTTVQVGTQVSGMIQKLYVDYNSPVKLGQAIAQIDPALFNAQVEQTRGNYLNSKASAEKARVTLRDAVRTQDRNRRLLQEGIVSQSDFDTAETAMASAKAALQAASASVGQALGAYRQAQTNLNYSTIRSPVDGIVISRNVDVGQTVAASFQTPTLFTIAQDLTKMQIETNVDEADISRIKLGQTARFTVDAYPEITFPGTVKQIRYAPVVTQNVVTYIVVISVDNREMKLRPGMTANVNIEVARKENVIKVANAALRFVPRGPDGAPEKRAGGESKKTVRGGGQRVYVLSDGKPRPVAITTGIANTGHVEVVSGRLKENDEVIVEQVQPKKDSGTTRAPMGPRF